MLTSIRFQNFKGLRDYSTTLHKTNIFVGPNNSGKSSILDALRVLSSGIKHARRFKQTLLTARGISLRGYEIPKSSIPISLENIHCDYNNDDPAIVTFRLSNKNKIILTFHDSNRCIMTIDTTGIPPRNIAQFRHAFPEEIFPFPTLGPLEEQEDVLSREYVDRWRGSRLAHRMFRNIWHIHSDKFEDFQRLVSNTWPEMKILLPELQGYAPPYLSMFCEENRKTRELCWAGFGFQVWIQLLTHIVHADTSTVLVVDEPEIYLHPDLQKKLFKLLKGTGKQIILATHSVEIVNEAEHDEVVIVNRSKKALKEFQTSTDFKKL